MINKLSIRDLDLKGKRVFVRVDFNVPLDDQGRVANDARIQASLPTIQWALQRQGRVILASHLGRPKGKVNPKMSLKPVAEVLSKALNFKVPLAPDCVGEAVAGQIRQMKDGQAVLLENLRFHPEE